MKLLVWGTGNFAREILDNGIEGEIIGFIETNKSKNPECQHMAIFSDRESPSVSGAVNICSDIL